MDQVGCTNLIFSSSATVYGQPETLPLTEEHKVQPMNPYGRTKLFIEEMIKDWCRADPQKSAVLLRYFNPVGAHASGQIGESPSGVPNNLMPFIRRSRLEDVSYFIFGQDYDTLDGTGVRDYIHVCDLADGHLAALDYCLKPLVQTSSIWEQGAAILSLNWSELLKKPLGSKSVMNSNPP